MPGKGKMPYNMKGYKAAAKKTKKKASKKRR